MVGARPRFIVEYPPRDRFYADPFVVEHEGRTWVFIEDYRYATEKGLISCSQLIDGRLAEPRVVLERDYHVSYPALLFWKGNWYMTPETSKQRAVELYRAVEFPWRWELDSTVLQNVTMVDPTILEHNGLLWLFATAVPPGGTPHDELSIYWADDLRGPWRPHAKNPVVSDVRSARPAGRPFIENGTLYRPAQNCAIEYGHSITLNRIDTLTIDRYSESPASTIDPTWLPTAVCTHTLNFSEHWLVTDGLRVRWWR